MRLISVELTREERALIFKSLCLMSPLGVHRFEALDPIVQVKLLLVKPQRELPRRDVLFQEVLFFLLLESSARSECFGFEALDERLHLHERVCFNHPVA
jgi:hypothetical protein